MGGVRTGIKLLAIGGESAAVVDFDLVALLGLAIALDGVGDVDLDAVVGGEYANGGGGQESDGACEELHCFINEL
jgi:hypothetical protein